MTENTIKIKSISELMGEKFFIPSYQRGYRWTKQQVVDLLHDIDSFAPKQILNSNEKTWYCLQPIVVKPRESQWEVIDGQQRLTTIYLILHYLNQGYVENRRRKLCEIEYETRNTEKSDSKTFLCNVNEKTERDALENIDYFHIFTAYDAIQKWFENKGNAFDTNCFESKIFNNTKIIWYETNEDDAVKIFTRINMGKIPLTPAELIKALFLNNSNFRTTKDVELKQLEIASEWDFIEYSLHNEEFWCFVNNNDNKETRIEFIFELLVGKPENKDDDTYTFRKYCERFRNKSQEEIEKNWKQVKRYFQTLQDWFDNRELYHKIGFLVCMDENVVRHLIEESQTMSKIEFVEYINKKISNRFTALQLTAVEYGNGNSMMRSILLLHNILTMLQNTKENSHFPFYRYKNENWDVEHIHALASYAKVKDEEQKKWLEENFEHDESVHNNEVLNKRIDDVLHNGTKDENFHEIVEYVLGEDDNALRNLCLLDMRTNRSYKNDSFKNKRKKIIEQEKYGTFIPICTRNVFMKYYSQDLVQLGQWSETDRESYSQNIYETLKTFLPPQNRTNYGV